MKIIVHTHAHLIFKGINSACLSTLGTKTNFNYQFAETNFERISFGRLANEIVCLNKNKCLRVVVWNMKNFRQQLMLSQIYCM